jgi:hypothetical protein
MNVQNRLADIAADPEMFGYSTCGTRCIQSGCFVHSCGVFLGVDSVVSNLEQLTSAFTSLAHQVRHSFIHCVVMDHYVELDGRTKGQVIFCGGPNAKCGDKCFTYLQVYHGMRS